MSQEMKLCVWGVARWLSYVGEGNSSDATSHRKNTISLIQIPDIAQPISTLGGYTNT